uniref:Replication protein n=1 Tax=Acidithiobacillus ferridurans TaxID=1232575 RepID=P96101_ACIFI|nr:hypothetical protein [Acidithiobacillus ferridurans]AAC80181.1 replication protein [Acidithiobacillus ferridurans]
MADNNVTKKNPPTRRSVAPVSDTAFAGWQLSLFQGFLANTDDQVESLSNAVDLWDSIPRYSISRARMNTMRTADGFLGVASCHSTIVVEHIRQEYIPHRLKINDGQWKSYYPSAREELVEYALRKISAEQGAGFFDRSTYRSGARFSLYQLRKELEQQGHQLAYDQIIEALDILSLSSIEIECATDSGDGAFARSTYFAALSGVKRKDYETHRDTRWIAQFHPLVTQSIDHVTYRQFNYQRMMTCSTQLARWLIGQLVLKYTQAAMLNSFEIRYSTIKRDSALLAGYKLDRQAIAALDQAWDELKSLGALSTVKKIEQRGARSKLEDVIYTLHPTQEFVAEQKAANRRQNNAKDGISSAVEMQNRVEQLNKKHPVRATRQGK